MFVHKSSVRKMKQMYLQILKEGGNTTEIPYGKKGCPLKLVDLHGQVQIYIHKLYFNKCN